MTHKNTRGTIPGDYITRWFHFDNGSNPYGVYGHCLSEFFNMLLGWNVTVEPNTHTKGCSFQCHEERPYYKNTKVADYEYRKQTLRDFAIEWQAKFADCTYSYEDLAWWSNFFTKYGKKYGLLTEFHENGIC